MFANFKKFNINIAIFLTIKKKILILKCLNAKYL